LFFPVSQKSVQAFINRNETSINKTEVKMTAKKGKLSFASKTICFISALGAMETENDFSPQIVLN